MWAAALVVPPGGTKLNQTNAELLISVPIFIVLGQVEVAGWLVWHSLFNDRST